MSSNSLTKNSTNDNDSNVDDEPTHTLSSLTTLHATHTSLTQTHHALRKAYLALELELRWYSAMHINAHADLQAWQTACRALEAERDALEADRRLAMKAKRGPFGGRLWGREKMGEVWKMQGEFVWLKVEERGWVKMVKGGGWRGLRRVGER